MSATEPHSQRSSTAWSARRVEPHDQVGKLLCKLWGKAWSCLPSLLAPAFLLQGVQNVFPAKTTKCSCDFIGPGESIGQDKKPIDCPQSRRLGCPLTDHCRLPRLPEPPFRRAAPTTPADRAGARVDYLPRSRGLPPMAGGSASALSLSRPAQASLTLRPGRSLSCPQATFVTRLQPLQLPARAARPPWACPSAA